MTDDTKKEIAKYLLAAISDSQAILRAVDTKINILFAILLIPLTKFPELATFTYTTITKQECGGTLVICIAALTGATFWALSVITAFRTLLGIDNPSSHIADGGGVLGTFYAGQLFQSAGASRLPISESLAKHVSDLPTDLDAIIRELAYEQMKLCYIRTVKFARYRRSMILAGGALISIGILLLLSFAMR